MLLSLKCNISYCKTTQFKFQPVIAGTFTDRQMGCNESKNIDQAVHQKPMLVIYKRKDKKAPRKWENSDGEIHKRVTDQEKDDIKEPFLLRKANLFPIKEETEAETEFDNESFYSADLEHTSEEEELELPLSSHVH